MASVSSSSLHTEGLATINFEILKENINNNNIQLYDMANRENGFWSQPEEEEFYTPQPLFSLVPQLPFANTVYIDGDYFLPEHVDVLFGGIVSDDDGSLEAVEIETDGTRALTETVASTLLQTETVDATPSIIEKEDDTPFINETVDDTHMISDLRSPNSTANLDADATNKAVVIETVDGKPFITERVDDTKTFADIRSPSRTSSLDPVTTDESVVMTTTDDTGMFADLRSASSTSSVGPDTTEDYKPNADLRQDIVWDPSVSGDIRSPSRISSLDSFILQASDINDDVLEATKDALIAACEEGPSTVEGARYLDHVIQVTRDILMTTCETEDDGTRETMEESLNLIRGYEILRDTGIHMMDAGELTADELREFIVRTSTWCGLPCFSASEPSLSQPAKQESTVEPHDDLPDDWAVGDCGQRVDLSISAAHIPWNDDRSLMYNNTDAIDRWLHQSYGQGEDDVTLFNLNSYYDNSEELLPMREPRLSQSSVDMHTPSRKRKLDEINEMDDEELQSRSDSCLISRQIPRAKRMRLYQNCGLLEDDVAHFYDLTYHDNNEEFTIPLTEPSQSQSAMDIRTASKKRKMEEMDEVLESRSDSSLISRPIASAKRRRI